MYRYPSTHHTQQQSTCPRVLSRTPRLTSHLDLVHEPTVSLVSHISCASRVLSCASRLVVCVCVVAGLQARLWALHPTAIWFTSVAARRTRARFSWSFNVSSLPPTSLRSRLRAPHTWESFGDAGVSPDSCARFGIAPATRCSAGTRARSGASTRQRAGPS